MKKVIGFLLVAIMLNLLLTGCHEVKKQKYIYDKQDIVPDSNKVKLATWIKETMSSTSSQMTTSDYEDPEDVIVQLEETGNKLFSVKVEGLKILRFENGYEVYTFFPYYELSDEETKIFKDLKQKGL